MNETYELLFRTMEENWLHARQAEDKRAMIATVNLIIVSAINGIIAFTGLNQRLIPLTIWMIVIGVYGIVSSLKLYERSQFHILRARKLRARLDELCPDAHEEQLQRDAEKEHKLRYGRMIGVRLNNVWLGLHAFIIVLGGVYTILCFV